MAAYMAWESDDGVRFFQEPNTAIEEAILRASPDYTKAVVEIGGASGRARYIYNIVDLNGDGNPEAFVYLIGSFFLRLRRLQPVSVQPG